MWLALRWGLVQSLKIRLLAMLHIGFVWLGLAFVLGGASQWLGLVSGAPVLGLGALHALSMGCLGSLMLAMVTRVSCGHSGHALVADADSFGQGLAQIIDVESRVQVAPARRAFLSREADYRLDLKLKDSDGEVVAISQGLYQQNPGY